MALVLPMLIILMFGGMEGGYYLWSEHKVLKAVRDGARYASRQAFDKFDCAGGTVSDPAKTNIQNLTRTGRTDTSGSPKVPNWTANSTVVVTVACDPAKNTGLYSEMPNGAPIVRVSANFAYPSLFFNLGFAASSLSLRASSQAAVMGL